ncbi:unnamed protein product [Hymenolepis diminuta]|uniref:Uncharacterized protein n=1 Tax=Hymenolepis diminuta TaxID=6216 RepID=A0A564YJF5_HYMDI|nr:unnamed protein product [Hymenolepis diminuta]
MVEQNHDIIKNSGDKCRRMDDVLDDTVMIQQNAMLEESHNCPGGRIGTKIFQTGNLHYRAGYAVKCTIPEMVLTGITSVTYVETNESKIIKVKEGCWKAYWIF